MDAVIADPCADPSLTSLEDACSSAAAYCDRPLLAETVALEEASGRIVSAPIAARIPLPPFDQSAMDGYALRAADVTPGRVRLRVASRIAAGQTEGAPATGVLEAARIFTGAPLPCRFDSVVMQEHVEQDRESIWLSGPIRVGSNVRRQGEDCRPGDPLLAAGDRLNARAIALLAAQGLAAVDVTCRPRIGIFSTGNELRAAGDGLDAAAIYDSNRAMLVALGNAAGARMIDLGQAGDDRDAIAMALRSGARLCDLLVTTGGVSVGEEDHTAAALKAAGAHSTTLRIAMKPGKPAIVGRIGPAAFLGLPGSPAAALAGWLTLAKAMLAALEGRTFDLRPGLRLPLAHHHSRRPGRRELTPAQLVAGLSGTELKLIGKAGSGRLVPLSLADGLADIDAGAGELAPGEVVGFHPFRD